MSALGLRLRPRLPRLPPSPTSRKCRPPTSSPTRSPIQSASDVAEVYHRTFGGRVTFIDAMTRAEIEEAIERAPWEWHTAPRGFASWPAGRVRGVPVIPLSRRHLAARIESLGRDGRAEKMTPFVATIVADICAIILLSRAAQIALDE
jgi:hypothetical protein